MSVSQVYTPDRATSVSATTAPALHHLGDDGPGDPPLGPQTAHDFRERFVQLEPGCSILLFTDGLVERRDESLSGGLERLRRSAELVRSAADPAEAIDAIIQSLLGEQEPSDDVALLLLELEAGSASVG